MLVNYFVATTVVVILVLLSVHFWFLVYFSLELCAAAVWRCLWAFSVKIYIYTLIHIHLYLNMFVCMHVLIAAIFVIVFIYLCHFEKLLRAQCMLSARPILLLLFLFLLFCHQIAAKSKINLIQSDSINAKMCVK